MAANIEKLPPLEFLSLCSAVKDIFSLLEYSDIDAITMPLFQYIRPEFKKLVSLDNAESATKYCNYRLKAIEYLKDNNLIIDFKVSDED